MSSGTEIHPMVHLLTSDLQFTDGVVALSDESFETWRGTMRGVAEVERDAVAASLVATALRLHGMGAAGSRAAVAQLCELSAILIGADAATASFASADVVADRSAKKLLGQETTIAAPMFDARPTPSGFMPPRRLR